jgi:hypothetical protein
MTACFHNASAPTAMDLCRGAAVAELPLYLPATGTMVVPHTRTYHRCAAGTVLRRERTVDQSHTPAQAQQHRCRSQLLLGRDCVIASSPDGRLHPGSDVWLPEHELDRAVAASVRQRQSDASADRSTADRLAAVGLAHVYRIPRRAHLSATPRELAFEPLAPNTTTVMLDQDRVRRLAVRAHVRSAGRQPHLHVLMDDGVLVAASPATEPHDEPHDRGDPQPDDDHLLLAGSRGPCGPSARTRSGCGDLP